MLVIREKSLIELNINGSMKTVVARPADTLLTILRDQLGLTGAKNSCGMGDCDSCTVLLDGWPVKSCLILAVEAIDHAVVTIEGLNHTPIQEAFVEKFAIQCGYCTPGMIMNCHALIAHHPNASEEIIQEWLEANICRCTGYAEIKEAIQTVISN